MVLISARFLSLLLTALAAGVVVSHVMSRAGKITLPGPLFIAVQNTLYRSWGKKVGALDCDRSRSGKGPDICCLLG